MKILKFFSPTCGPCKILEKNLQKTDLEYESIDVTQEGNDQYIVKYNIKSLPFMVKIDDDGNVIKSFKGVISSEYLMNYFK